MGETFASVSAFLALLAAGAFLAFSTGLTSGLASVLTSSCSAASTPPLRLMRLGAVGAGKGAPTGAAVTGLSVSCLTAATGFS